MGAVTDSTSCREACVTAEGLAEVNGELEEGTREFFCAWGLVQKYVPPKTIGFFNDVFFV